MNNPWDDVLFSQGLTPEEEPQCSLENLIEDNEEEEEGTDGTMYLVDADSICYAAASVTDGSQWWILDPPGSSGIRVDLDGPYKYQKEAIARAKDMRYEDILYEQRWEPEPVENAIAVMKSKLSVFKGKKALFFLSPSVTFRHTLDTDYKANRKGKRVPKHLKACRDWLIKEHSSVVHKSLEADDLVIIYAEECRCRCHPPWVIVGIDKDLKQIEGNFNNFELDNPCHTSRATGRRNLWRQVASGDTVDNIRTPKGLGPKTFDKHFSSFDFNVVDDYTLMVRMTELYLQYMPGDNTKEKVQEAAEWVWKTARLVYLLRDYDDKWEVPKNDGGIRW